MQLKNLDKYIKEKVQGYKAPYEADLWKGIEERLPPPRVPNGRGSWMLPVAAIVAIAVLVPFTIKFYNLTGRAQVMALKKDETGKLKTTVLSNNTKAPMVPEKPNLAISSMLSQDALKSEKTGHYSHAVLNYREQSKNHSKIYRGDHTIENVSQEVIQKTAVASNIENTSKNEMMPYISPGISTIENNASEDITNPDDTRYPERNNHHPVINQKWENWQTIYYPFWDNPAFAGSEGMINVSGDYESDNIKGTITPSSQHTYTNLGIDGYVPGIGLGFGAFKVSELSPFSLQNTYGIAFSKSLLQIGSTSIKIGISGTKIDDNIFFNELNYSDQINPKFGFINATSEKYIAGTTSALGLNGGIWVSNPRVIAGFDVQDINQPKLGFSSDAIALTRQWRGTLGYRFAIGPDCQFMPMAIVTRENNVNQANATFTAVYKDKYMLSFAYENINPISGLGNAYIYGSVRIAKRFRVFGSYGRDLDLLQTGVNENFVHAGLNFLVIR